jgi:hypothetical protein
LDDHRGAAGVRNPPSEPIILGSENRHLPVNYPAFGGSALLKLREQSATGMFTDGSAQDFTTTVTWSSNKIANV